MATQKYMGRGQLIDRLTAQVGDRKKAIEILIKRGHLKPDGKTLTDSGLIRNNMTSEERAKDRKSKYTGLSPDIFDYNPKTNSVRRKK